MVIFVRQIFIGFFAVVGFLVTLVIVAGITLAVENQGRAPKEPEAVILALDFDQAIVEQNDPSPLDFALHETSVSLFDILAAIDKAKSDPHVKALIARFGTTQPGLAQAQEIRAAMERFRTSGKPTYAYATSYGDFGMGNRTYYLASTFDNIWLQPVGSVSLTGVAIESPFGKSALDKLGVTADFMQREEYKSFMEMGMRDDFSPPVRVEMQAMVEDMAHQVATGIASSRKWAVDRVQRLMERGPYTDDEAAKAGLVTHVGYADELDDELKQKFGKDAKQVDVDSYLEFHASGKSKTAQTRVALIFGTGLITDHADGAGSFSGDKAMGADDIADAFDDAADDKDVKAILFRIDSPGGSPEASETIRHALIHAQKAGKPVFVSMGEVAASGGYWIAMNADHIVADPGTLTGSIGVISGKFVVDGLLQKLGVHFDTLSTSENAGMWSIAKEFSPMQRERVNAMLDQTYHVFVSNVSAARKIPMEKMPDIAKGRVWTGEQAVKVGLVDELGGVDVALGSLRKKLKLTNDESISLEPFPPPPTPAEKIMKLLKGFGVEGAMIRSALMQWQAVQASVGPVWKDVTLRGSVAAQVPSSVLQLAR